jgi:hypothetical protein
MEWVAPNKEPLSREELIAFFEAARQQTRKNGNRNNADRTRTWASNLRDVMTRVPGAPPPAPPPPPLPPTSWTGTAQPGTRIGARTPEEKAAIEARLAPHNAEVRADIARRAAEEAAAAAAAASSGRNKLRRGLHTRRIGNIRRRAQDIQAEQAAAAAAAAKRGRNTLRRGLRRHPNLTRRREGRLANIRRRAAELPPSGVWTGTLIDPSPRNETDAERAARESLAARQAAEQALLPPGGVWTGTLIEPPPRNETEAERAVRESVAARQTAKRGRNKLRHGLRRHPNLTRRREGRMANIRRRAQEIKAEEEAARARIIEKAQRNLNALRASSRNREAPNDGRLVLQEPKPRPGRRNTALVESSNNLDYYNSNAAAAATAAAAPAPAAPPLPRRGWRNWARGLTVEQAAEAKAERARLREEAAIEARLKQQLDQIKAKAGPTNERLVEVRLAVHKLQEYIAERERDINEKEEEIRQKKVEATAAAAAYNAAKGTRDEEAKRSAAAVVVRSLRNKESMLQKLQKYVQEARSKIERHQAEQTELEAAEAEQMRQARAASEAAVADAERRLAEIARMFRQPPNPAQQASLNAELAELSAL